MTFANPATSDSGLWEAACRDDQAAFEEIVLRHQGAVCAVAYNACGDLANSEDVSQETFWIAWRDRRSLIDPARLRAWLCGIARNLARNSFRRSSKATSIEACVEPAAAAQEPDEQAVSKEEETLVWDSLAQVPEMYREPLILFYRENQSIAEVATTLELSVDAVKQRLSRGRNLLRDQVAELIEGTLRRSGPRRQFTIGVMAGLTSLTAGSQAAFAGTGTAAASTVGGIALAKGATAVATGTFGGMLGIGGGLLGGWLGSWVPAQMAPTNRERQYHLAVGRRLLIVSLVLCLAFVGVVAVLARSSSPGMIATIVVSWFCLLNAYIGIEVLLLIRAVQKIRRETTPESDPNDSWLKAYVQQRVVNRWEGRIYRSSRSLLGLPLIDIQVSSPDPEGKPQPLKRARGWIAIGDRADGALLAIGGIARGTIAIGGTSFGLVSVGGLSVGLFAIGGLAVGAICFGGLAIGGLAIGGGAIGWQAAGGGAIAWDVACGGGALAHRAAFGGAAMAQEFAVGGSATARHANDEMARAILESHWLVRSMNMYSKNLGWLQFPILIACFIPAVAMHLLMYRRRRVEGTSSGQATEL